MKKTYHGVLATANFLAVSIFVARPDAGG